MVHLIRYMYLDLRYSLTLSVAVWYSLVTVVNKAMGFVIHIIHMRLWIRVVSQLFVCFASCIWLKVHDLDVCRNASHHRNKFFSILVLCVCLHGLYWLEMYHKQKYCEAGFCIAAS